LQNSFFETASLEPIGQGRNNQVYLAMTVKGERYILKHYYRDISDKRDRLGTEFSALEFLWNNGVRTIPKPIKANKELGMALYEYIDGVFLEKTSQKDLDAAIQLIQNLKKLSTSQEAKNFYNASEACFSAKAIVQVINNRLGRLIEALELKEFLEKDFIPAFQTIKRGDEKETESKRKTLSPSDFGFHNARKRLNGEIVFLDFEYFGWDDPAKMICDFLLHPGMNLGQSLKQYFFKKAIGCFPEDHSLADRIRKWYPLLGLNWCLIFLNEFLPGKTEGKFRKEEQLAKANQKLKTITQNGFNLA